MKLPKFPDVRKIKFAGTFIGMAAVTVIGFILRKKNNRIKGPPGDPWGA
jgi:hypothetical protein